MSNYEKEVTFAHIDGEIVGIATILKGKVRTLKSYGLQEGLDILRIQAGPKSNDSLSTIVTIVPPKSYVYPIESINQPATQNDAAQLLLESKNFGAGEIATALQFYTGDTALYESLEGDSVAFATPGGWLQDLRLDGYNIKLVPHVFALNESPGLHLHIGWNSCELILIENGRIRITRSFATGGLGRVARLLGPRGKELLLNEFNEESTPSSDSEIYTFAEEIFDEYLSTLEDWKSKGLVQSEKLYLHGVGTLLKQIIDIMRSEGIEPYLSKEDEESLSLLDKRFQLLGFMQLLLSRKRISEIEIILLRGNRKDIKAIEIKAKKNNFNKYKLVKALFLIITSVITLFVAITLSSQLNKTQITPPSERNDLGNSNISVPNKAGISTADRDETSNTGIDFKDLACENQIGILKEFLEETPDISTISDKSTLNTFKEQMGKSFAQCGIEGKNDVYEIFYNEEYSSWTVSNKVDIVNLEPLTASQ